MFVQEPRSRGFDRTSPPEICMRQEKIAHGTYLLC